MQGIQMGAFKNYVNKSPPFLQPTYLVKWPFSNRLILLLTDQDRHSNLGRKKPQKQLSINNGLNSRLFWKEITSQSLRFFGQNWSCFLFFSVNLFGQVTLTLDKNNNLTDCRQTAKQKGQTKCRLFVYKEVAWLLPKLFSAESTARWQNDFLYFVVKKVLTIISFQSCNSINGILIESCFWGYY